MKSVLSPNVLCRSGNQYPRVLGVYCIKHLLSAMNTLWIDEEISFYVHHKGASIYKIILYTCI